MVSIPTRWIVVDGASPRINYIGNSWFSQTGNPISTADSGLPFQNNTHGTNTNASLTYNFSGKAITIKGAVQTSNVSSPDNPTWACLVDGVQIGSDISRRPSTPTVANNWIYCQSYKLTDGPHTFVMNVTGTQKTFWFDRIEYAPSASVSLENATIAVSGPGDEAFRFSAGWSFGQTTERGASMTFDFIGTMLTWWTQYVLNGNSTTATWSIDDQPAKNATLPDHKSGSLYNQKLFDTGKLEMGPHRLSVSYNGNASNTPLVLASIFIENGTSTKTATSDSGSNTSGGQPMNSGTKAAPIIIGGVVGVIALLFIITTVFLFVYFRRRQRNSSLSFIDKFDVGPARPFHSDTLKPHFNFYNRMSPSEPGASPRHIVHPQPMPRKVRDEMEHSIGGTSSSSSNGRLTQPPGLYQPMPRKALENMAVTRGGGPDHPVNREPTQLPPGPNKGRIVVHEDSGVRLNNQQRSETFVDTPPEYNLG